MDFSSEQIDQQEYEINSNPALQRSEFAPIAKREYFHEKVYKTLVTLGDFKCYVWFYDEDYDDTRTVNGTKKIHIVPSEERIDDSIEINRYFNIANTVWSEGVIYVNAIFRRNGTAFTQNKDLKDCVKYFSGVAPHYGADKDKIVAIDIADNEKMYDMNYDSVTSNTYADISNNVYTDFTSGAVGNGTLSLNYSTVFASGVIPMSSINSTYGKGNNLGAYYRGTGIADIPQNNQVPTSGAISFSNLRNTVKKITAAANGNWMHLQARYEVFGDSAYTSSIEKELNIGGNVGSSGNDNPAIRFNDSGGGSITLNINNTSGSPVVRGYAGDRGSAGGGDGGTGGIAMTISSPIKMPLSHWNDRVRGGGGGGGGGGTGGQGGGGGHSGHRVCTGWFCNGSYLVCHGNGGTGGNGGAGGQGGRGDGYYWDGSNWIATHSAGQSGGAAGAGGQGGNSRGGGTGGGGGNGGTGGGFEGGGADGTTGGDGSNGAGSQHGCGGHPGGQNGKAGTGGGSGAAGGGRANYSSGGNVTYT